MNRLFTVLFGMVFLVGCAGKKEKKPDVPAANFFPVPSYVRGELKKLDTSLATFLKIETVNGVADTTPIKNSEARAYAADFLALPDISSSDLKNDYEVSHLYDEIQEAFVFNFTTREKHPLREENVTVDPQPDAAGKNEIKSIYAKLEQDSSGTPVTKILLWTAGKSFYTTTIAQAPGGAEQIRKVQIVWNGFEDPNK